jgi:hypothetical protein
MASDDSLGPSRRSQGAIQCVRCREGIGKTGDMVMRAGLPYHRECTKAKGDPPAQNVEPGQHDSPEQRQ